MNISRHLFFLLLRIAYLLLCRSMWKHAKRVAKLENRQILEKLPSQDKLTRSKNNNKSRKNINKRLLIKYLSDQQKKKTEI